MKDTEKNNEKDVKLIEKAKSISRNARVPLSGFHVGAAILSENGNIYVGCNIEFDNYTNTIHAEESAISAMVSAGDSKPIKIAVFTNADEPCFPCGMCRQSLFELGHENLEVIACNNESVKKATMGDLMPHAFHL